MEVCQALCVYTCIIPNLSNYLTKNYLSSTNGSFLRFIVHALIPLLVHVYLMGESLKI